MSFILQQTKRAVNPDKKLCLRAGQPFLLGVDAQGRTQAELLLAEGITATDGKVRDFPVRFIGAQARPHKVEPHKHCLAEE